MPALRFLLFFVCAAATVPLRAEFLFSYFTKNGEDGLPLAASVDGYKWERLNDGKSYLTPTFGKSKLMRDPGVVRGPDGVFHMVGTSGWNENNIGHASTWGFIQWSSQQEALCHDQGRDAQSAEEVPPAGREHRHSRAVWETVGAFHAGGIVGRRPDDRERGQRLLLYFDAGQTKHYGAMRSRDLKTWEDVTPRLSLPDEGTPVRMRHGTVIEVDSTIPAKLRRGQ